MKISVEIFEFNDLNGSNSGVELGIVVGVDVGVGVGNGVDVGVGVGNGVDAVSYTHLTLPTTPYV